jgi:hypothetical protein
MFTPVCVIDKLPARSRHVALIRPAAGKRDSTFSINICPTIFSRWWFKKKGKRDSTHISVPTAMATVSQVLVMRIDRSVTTPCGQEYSEIRIFPGQRNEYNTGKKIF